MDSRVRGTAAAAPLPARRTRPAAVAGLAAARRTRPAVVAGLAAAAALALAAAPAAAYDVTGPNMAPSATASASSALGGYPVAAVNDGVRQTGAGYWNDATQNAFPDWVQLAWGSARRIDRIALRLPIASHLSGPQRTTGPITLSWWDAAASAWRTVSATGNPVSSWIAPTSDDGSQLKVFDTGGVTTARVRVTYSGGNSDGWSFLEEIEAYERETAVAPFTIAPLADSATRIVQPGDALPLGVAVRDSLGRVVDGYPVTFAISAAPGAAFTSADQDAGTAGHQRLTSPLGVASATVRTGPAAGTQRFAASGPGGTPATSFAIDVLGLADALTASLAWLERTAGALERGSIIRATDGTPLYTPDGVAGYASLWTRDFQYMIEGYPEGIPGTDVRANIDYLMRAQRSDGAIPDHVWPDGTPQYCAGNDSCGSFGPTPTLDNSQFMVKLVHAHWRHSGDLVPFTTHAARLVRAMEYTPRSPRTALTFIDPLRPGSPYGFTDTVRKTGDQLYDSLLYVEAADGLAELFTAAGDATAAQHWREQALLVAADVQTLYDPVTGMFMAASLQNRQVDVWGSALAARIGVASRGQQWRIARYLIDNYSGLVLRGQVRHIAPGRFWENPGGVSPGLYQNGAYWATPSGDVAHVIATLDKPLARQMLVDMTKDFIAEGVHEAINDSPYYRAIPKYVASATNPIPTMRALTRP